MAKSAQPPISSPAALTVLWGVLAVVAVLPLLVDLSNVDDTYYGIKASVLLAVSALILAGLFADRWGRAALLRDGAPLLAFGAAAVLATVYSVAPAAALWGSPWRHEGLLVLLAYLVVCAASSRIASVRFQLWSAALLAGGALSALYGLAQFAGYEWLIRDPVRAGWVNAFGASGHPNYFGALMILVAPFAASAALGARSAGRAAAAGGLTVLVYTAALCSFSRAAWAGLLAAAVLMTILVRRAAGGTARRRGAVLLGALAAATAIFLLPAGPLAPRDGSSPIVRAATVAALRSNKVADRVYLWDQTARLVIRRPVTGYGPDTFAAVFPQEWDERRRELWGAQPRTIDRAHNDTLDVLMSVGVVGLAAYWWIVGSAVRRALRAAGGDEGHTLRGIAAVTAIAAYLLTLQFGFSVVSVAPVFWSVLGTARGLGGDPA